MSSGSKEFIDFFNFEAPQLDGMPTDATCPVACTPVSVRPDPVTVRGEFANLETTDSMSPCTVRWSGWVCQP